MDKDIVLLMDSVSRKTKQSLNRHVTEYAKLVYSDGDKELLKRYLPEAKILVTSTKGISEEMLEKAQRCIYIQKLGAGTNNIDIEQAKKRGIPVGNVPAMNSRSVAEMTLALLLAVYKQIIRGHNELIENGKWLKTVLRDNNYELTGKTIGLIGLGNIGINLVQLLAGFQCRIYYYDKYRLTPDNEKAIGVSFVELEDLIAEADVISIHCPLNEDTVHMIDARRLALMKSDSVLINCARGGIVDEEALYTVLSEEKILGAGIDTFESEPIDQNHPFTKLKNVVLSPHNAGGTVEAIETVVSNAAVNINSMLLHGTIENKTAIVNNVVLTGS